MGLDMYARTMPGNALTAEQQVDFNDAIQKAHDAGELQEIHYWRKHHDLHGWMEQLYTSKGGTESCFNCVPVRLEAADLDALEKAVTEQGAVLPVTTGFFFGNNPPDRESREGDLEFIRKAREALAAGLIVFYDSWW